MKGIIIASHPISGCTDPTADNYDASATQDDGSCFYFLNGCTDSTALNYNPIANIDDGSCIPFIYGCTNSSYYNYSPQANTDDGSCVDSCGFMDMMTNLLLIFHRDMGGVIHILVITQIGFY